MKRLVMLASTMALLISFQAFAVPTPDQDHDHGQDHGQHHDHGQHRGWDKHYGRGDHLPEQYRGREYYVNDYQHYQLRKPKLGYRWIRGDDGQFLLVSMLTGFIADEVIRH